MSKIVHMIVHHGKSQGLQSNIFLIIRRVILKEGTYEKVIFYLV
jgi:hypothetical protein